MRTREGQEGDRRGGQGCYCRGQEGRLEKVGVYSTGARDIYTSGQKEVERRGGV